MKSLTKVDLSADQLNAAVGAAFGPSVSLRASEEFHDGWFNTIHGLELSDGRRLVLKTAPKPGVPVLRHEGNLLATEVLVYGMLERAGVPSPRVVFSEPTGTLLGLPFFLMERIGLPTYSKAKEGLSKGDQALVEESLGRVNAEINAITGPTFGSVGEPGYRNARWSAVFEHMLEDTLADGQDKGTTLPVSDDRIRDLLARLRPALDLVTEPRLVHWDLHDANAFIDGTRVAAVIDADRAQWADPLMEIYFSPFFDRTSFCRGYGSDPMTLVGAEQRRALYDLHLGVIMVVEADYRGFDDGHKAWAREALEKVVARCEALGAV